MYPIWDSVRPELTNINESRRTTYKRITFDNEHYFIDLVFYNAILKCYVVIDQKTDK